MHEDVVVDNNGEEKQHMRLELVFDADFADLFEVKEGRVPGATSTVRSQTAGCSSATRAKAFRAQPASPSASRD
jgi:glycogen debranching enzyme-like protein